MTEQTPDPAPGIGTPMSERMQALLSRAVEDQLSEQRQLAGALADVRSQLARLSDELIELRSAATREDDGTIEQRIGGISAEVREAVGLMGERLDGVTRLVAERVGELGDLRSAVGDLETELRSQAGSLTELTDALGAVPSYGDRLGALEQSIAQIGPMLGEVGEASLEHTNGLSELQSRFDAVARAVQDVAQRLTEREQGSGDTVVLAEQLRILQNDVTTLGGDVAGLVESALDRSTVQAAVDAAQDAVDRVGRVDDIASQVADLRLHLSGPQGVAANVEQLRAEVSAVSGSVESEELDARVRDIVAIAVKASEDRLSAHVDEAVLALAEALLRRRYPQGAAGVSSAGGGSTSAGPASGMGTSVGRAVLDDLEADISTDPEPDADEQPVTFIKSDRSEDATDSEAADRSAEQPVASEEADDPDLGEERAKKRRGWFRGE